MHFGLHPFNASDFLFFLDNGLRYFRFSALFFYNEVVSFTIILFSAPKIIILCKFLFKLILCYFNFDLIKLRVERDYRL